MANSDMITGNGIAIVLGFKETPLPMKYLGIPLAASRIKLASYQSLLNKVWNRLAGWKGITLSYTGRLELIKSTLATLHIFRSTYFLLPKA